MMKYASGQKQGDQIVCRKEGSGLVASEEGQQDACRSSHMVDTEWTVWVLAAGVERRGY